MNTKTLSNLLISAKQGNIQSKEDLLDSCLSTIKSIAYNYKIYGQTTDDLIQEGLLGALKAIEHYKISSDIPFISFLKICVNNQIINNLKKAQAKKRKILNNSTPIENLNYNISFIEKNKYISPEDELIIKDLIKNLKKELISSLTSLEKNVYKHYILGMSYQEIADILNKNTKSIDNAIKRIKNKFEKIIKSNNYDSSFLEFYE